MDENRPGDELIQPGGSPIESGDGSEGRPLTLKGVFAEWEPPEEPYFGEGRPRTNRPRGPGGVKEDIRLSGPRAERLGDWRWQFLEALEANWGGVVLACRQVRVSTRVAYAHRHRFPKFRAKWDEAVLAGVEKLKEEAHRRAMAGSDKQLIFLLQHRSDEFRQARDGGQGQVAEAAQAILQEMRRIVESAGGTLPMIEGKAEIDYSRLSDEQLREMKRLLG